MVKNNYSKWVIRHTFTQLKFINDSNLPPPTIETIEVPANENETVTRNNMLLLPCQGDEGIDLNKVLRRNLNKHLPNNDKTQILFKKLALNLMLRIGPNLNTNITFFLLVNVQRRIVLIIILVNLLGESLSE